MTKSTHQSIRPSPVQCVDFLKFYYHYYLFFLHTEFYTHFHVLHKCYIATRKYSGEKCLIIDCRPHYDIVPSINSFIPHILHEPQFIKQAGKSAR